MEISSEALSTSLAHLKDPFVENIVRLCSKIDAKKNIFYFLFQQNIYGICSNKSSFF